MINRRAFISGLQETNHEDSNQCVTPQERAKAVVADFPAVPLKIRPDLQLVITRAIIRALAQQLAELEVKADSLAVKAQGKGKQAKGSDPTALQFHRYYQRTFRYLRLNLEQRQNTEAPRPPVPFGDVYISSHLT